jgi:thrombospondin type 3 repeat protein
VSRTGGTSGGTFRWGHRVLIGGDGCTDPDSDVIWSTSDNCPSNANVDQANYEFDAEGDICDADDDNDTVADTADACPHGLRSFDVGGTSPDYDADGCKDLEDADDDGDGVIDTADGCPQGPKGVGGDTDGDGCKDFEETDDDNDGVPDAADNCPLNTNAKQTDTDRDGAGDACDPDDDGDGVIDSADAFPLDRTRSKGPKAAPVVSKLKLSPKSFAAKKKGASIAAKPKRKPAVGTTITYRTNVASKTTFTVQRIRKGVRRGKVAVGTFARRDKAGGAKLKFTGRVAFGKKTKTLAPGRYVLRVQGRNAKGAGKAVTAKFTIVKP